jgi:hypothetical protein
MQIPQLSFSSILTIGEYQDFFVVAIAFVLGLFALSKYIKKEHKNNGLLLCSLFLTPLLLALITDHPIRWVYFLPIPLILTFGIYLKDLFVDFVRTRAKTSKRTIRLLAICLIAIIGFYTTVMTFYHLLNATEFYQFIEYDEIEALNWIKKNTPPNAVLATSGHPKGDVGGGGNSYSWWVEGYCKRICISAGDLEYYSYQKERDQVQIANRIFAGTYYAEYENLRVTEDYPSITKNPEISAFIEGEYKEIFAIKDEKHQLFFSPYENKSQIGFYSENNTLSIDEDLPANITVTYDLPQFELTRSIIMGENKSSVDALYKILPKNTTLKLFKVNLWALFNTALENCEISEDYTVSLFPAQTNEGAETQIRILEHNGEIEDASVVFEDPKWSNPVISYSFKPIEESLYVHIRIIIESSSPKNDNNTQAIPIYDTYNLIKDLDIDYILINRYRINQFHRFLDDTQQSNHFTEIYQKGAIVIFKVN